MISSVISLISSLSLKFNLDSLVYHPNIFRSSPKVFGNLQKSSEIFRNSRKMFRNVSLAFRIILENLRKSPECSHKSSENHQKRHHQYVYIIKKHYMLARRYKLFYVPRQEQYLTRSDTRT